MSSKHAFVEQLKSRLDEWDDDLAQLEAQMHEAEEELKIAFEERLALLRQQRGEAAAKLEHLQQAADEAWEDLKEGAESAWVSIRAAIDKARQEFKD
ncbi:hypothetical protein [Methylogaea oryzae]|uniref:Coiled coil domain-containing protein n=1 Tax=Methylogaea oryzae TaxID=1295382 RepID=A0A8D4VTW8_9GAMM|nr:hypothetical protein [Methylogaea oryzae]BBL72552.1 hypothetical protein MoryE10_31580 [Methylogaea oryzae]